jgi:hypothetical protein
LGTDLPKSAHFIGKVVICLGLVDFWIWTLQINPYQSDQMVPEEIELRPLGKNFPFWANLLKAYEQKSLAVPAIFFGDSHA